MPRLPTMRVIGSQFISTRFRFLEGTSWVGAAMVLIRSLLSVGSGVIAGGEFGPRMPPFRFLVDSSLGQTAECANSAAIGACRSAGNLGARRLIHERHELVRESWHGAPDANAADVGTAADTGHPSAFGYIAVDHWSPTSQLHDALGRAVHFGEVALLVVAGTIAALVDGSSEEPGGTQLVVQRNHRRQTGHLVEQVKHGFHEIVWLYRASGNIDD